MKAVAVLLSLCALSSSYAYYPEITLYGDNPLYVAPAQEKFVDAGATCYDAGAGKSNKIKMNEMNSDKVNLAMIGTYHVQYTCTDGSGQKATPKQRTIVVDPKYQDDWWEGEASIQMTGYTPKGFGKTEQDQFRTALAASLTINKKELTITSVSAGKVENSVNIAFKISVVQETLINEIVDRMRDPQFDDSLAANLKSNNLQVAGGQSLAVAGVGMKKIITTGLLAGLGIGGLAVITFLVVGAYKLNQLMQNAKSGGYQTIGGHGRL
jgi:hypothetical protein